MVAEGFPERRVGVVHNGIAVNGRPTIHSRAAMRAALDLPADALVVGAVGRLDPVKSLATLIEAHALVLERHPATHLVLVGSGPERAALEALAASRGVSRSVHFTGFRSDARELMAAFDVYANASTHEGVSLT